jgi:hypothetical protein
LDTDVTESQSERSVPAPQTRTAQTVWVPAPKQESRVKAVILAALKAAGILKK